MVSCAPLAFVILVSVALLAEATNQGAVYIVHLEKTDAHPDSLEAIHLQILSTVCGGSHEKAKEAILYSYKNSMNGFSAKLSPDQVAELSQKPGVLAVNRQGVAQLHTAAGTQQGPATASIGRKSV